MQNLTIAHPVKTAIIFAAMLTAAVSLSGCYTPTQRAVGGGLIGGLGGAGIGALASGGAAYATLGGAAVGAAAGSLVGLATTPRYYRRRYY
jgi:hypothetical protein